MLLHMHIQRSLLLLAGGILVGAIGVGAFVLNTSPKGRVDLSRPAVVQHMRELGRLETAAVSVEKIVEARTGSSDGWYAKLFGDKLLLVAHGDAVAGVDLEMLDEDAVKVSGQKVTVKLPAPILFWVRLNNSETTVYDRSTGIFSRPDKDLEADARVAAEGSIKTAACEAGILDRAGASAERQIKALLSALGFTEVTVEMATPEAC